MIATEEQPDVSEVNKVPGHNRSGKSFASTSKAAPTGSGGRFSYDLDQFGSLGDLTQLTKYQYLQRFSRLYVATPEPQGSNTSNDSQSEPFCLTAGSSRSALLSGTGGATIGTSNKEHAGGSSSSSCGSNVGGMQSALISAHDSNSNEGNNGGPNFMAQFGNKDAPLCTKCKLHGIRNEVKGHKKSCPMKDCKCELCILTDYGKRLRGKKAKKLSLTGEEASDVIASLGEELRLSDQPEMFQNNVNLIVEMLKERLQKDGLDYQQEIGKLRDAVLYLLLKQFDKRKLYSKFIN